MRGRILILEIQTLSIIATFITSLVAMGTLWNATKQRINSQQPDIYIKDKSFIIDIAGEIPSMYEEDDNEKVTLKLFNIGLGSAKKITINWSLNEEFVIGVKELDKDNEYELELSGTEERKWIRIGVEGKSESVIQLHWDLKQEIDFMLPYSSREESGNLKLPRSINHLIGIYNDLFIKNNDIAKTGLPENIFTLTLTYFDVNNKKYTKKFKVAIGINSIIYGKEMNGVIKIL